MKLFIVAGEASGDLHAANLVKAMRQYNPSVEIEGWGGDLLAAQKVKIHKHIRALAFMGFKQVVMNLGTILSNFKTIKEQIKSANPDAVILVDYPGFNLRLAKWLKANQFNTIYYIMPQAWAWKEGRVKQLKQFIDLNICILPFEESFFKERGVVAEYCGHPLVAEIKLDKKVSKTIALLPGSRQQEIATMLPKMLAVQTDFPAYNFEILQSPNVDAAFYTPYLSNSICLAQNGAADLLNRAEAALVTSGTATLETALYEVPQIVCYASGAVSYQVAKRLIKVPYISLVNLIAEKEIVKELIQNDLNQKKLVAELKGLVIGGEKRKQQIENYQLLKKDLGDGDASHLAAREILAYLKNTL